MKYLLVSMLALSALMTACAGTDPNTGSTTGSVISVQYGSVQQVEQVQMQGSYGKDTLIGGGLGLLAASHASSGSQAAAAAGGALLGALFARSQETTAEKYTVALVNGGATAVVTEHHDIAVGDCVAVEQGQHANIRRVAATYCGTDASHPAYAPMHAAVQSDAASCQAAKQQVLSATTEQETEIAYRKVQALCGS